MTWKIYSRIIHNIITQAINELVCIDGQIQVNGYLEKMETNLN